MADKYISRGNDREKCLQCNVTGAKTRYKWYFRYDDNIKRTKKDNAQKQNDATAPNSLVLPRRTEAPATPIPRQSTRWQPQLLRTRLIPKPEFKKQSQ